MKSSIYNQFIKNYFAAFLLFVTAAACAFVLLSLVSSGISKTLMKNIYSAERLMRDDYREIDAASVAENGGGIQIIDGQYNVVYSAGINTIGKDRLTADEFTDFLTGSKEGSNTYHYDIKYNSSGEFWMVVTFPTSVRINFSLAYNREAASRDMKNVVFAAAAFLLFYMLLLALMAAVFSKITSMSITVPLKKLQDATGRLREGDYSARVDLGLTNEFAGLQDIFNDMAERIEEETSLRKQSEEDRKRMMLDISHDLKNPLSSIAGYAELCLKKCDPSDSMKTYLEVIQKNSGRADYLLTQLFELSCLENPSFLLKMCRTDICEYLRLVCGELVPALEQAEFIYEFDIPENEIYAMIDEAQMSRVFHNLAENAIRYNAAGTEFSVVLYQSEGHISICVNDNGAGIPAELRKDIFKPFVRVDSSRNSGTGGTGLGLSIASRIVEAHVGRLYLKPDRDKGCSFCMELETVR